MDKMIIDKAGRHTHSFKNGTISGLMFIIKHKTLIGFSFAESVSLSIKDKSDLNNPIDVLPSLINLKKVFDIQNSNSNYFVSIVKETEQQIDYLRIPFSFGSNKVLKAEQSIDVSIEFSSFSNVELFEVVPIYSIGLESDKYFIEELELDKLKTRQKISLGSWIDSLVYIGDSSLINRFKLNSDILNFEKSKIELFNFSNDKYETFREPSDSFLLASRTPTSPPLGNVTVELDFESLPPNNNLYVIRRITTPEISQSFSIKSAEHQSENYQKIRKADLADCTCKN